MKTQIKTPEITTTNGKQGSPVGVNELLAAGAALAGAIEIHGYKPIVLMPEGYTEHELQREIIAPLPDHIRQTVTLNDLDSFTAYVSRFQRPETVILASGEPAEFMAVFDYHRGAKDDGGVPGRVAHIALYPCPHSLEWKTWMGSNGKPLNQAAFVEFVDANSADVISPDSASLLELAQNFEMSSTVSFQSDIKRTTGGKVLRFVEDSQMGRSGSGGEMKVPDELSLSLPVFDGGKVFDLKARMEFRVTCGKLSIAYHLRRPHDALRSALLDLRKDIAVATGIAPLTGSI